MISKYQMIMGLLLYNFFMFGLIASSITMPGLPNPLGDLVPGFAQGASGTGAGTCNSSSISSCNAITNGPDTIAPQTQNVQSCLVGIGSGALIGGLAGLGIGSPFTAVGGAIVGGFVGCGLASTFFPSQGSAVFQYFANNAGPLGDFSNALVAALSWVGPVLKFFQDMVAYEFALLVDAPEIGVWLFPFQAVMAIMFLFIGAEYIRGTGIGA